MNRLFMFCLCTFTTVVLAACNSNEPDDPQIVAEAGKPDSTGNSVTTASQIVTASTINKSLDNQWRMARYATAGLIEHTKQRPGDPESGRRALIEQNYVNCGLPERVFRQLIDQSEQVEIDGRHQRAKGLPYSVNVFNNDEGVAIVANNCLTCHATPLFGELVIGLGNEFLDFTADASAQVEQAGALVKGAAETRAWELFADRMATVAPFIRTETVGVNPANNLTFALIAHRDAKTNRWSEQALLPLPPEEVPPVSVPPWWRMAKKPAMFSMGEGRNDHGRMMMAASMLCTDSMEELQTIDSYAPDIRAYIGSLTAPEYPFAIDQASAGTGQALFEIHCSGCHGTYPAGGQHEYPARLVAIDTVKTDRTLIDFAHGPGIAYIDWFNQSWFGEKSLAAPGPGYVAPPLDGIWATAPYLHNGSVPTIAGVIQSSDRPVFWKHTVSDASDPDSYDQQRLGWSHDVLQEGQLDDGDTRIYRTTTPGYSNAGHQFGDHLNDAQRMAVLEYLKTL